MSESEKIIKSESVKRSKHAIVSVSKHGQATIPKRFRERLGIDAPGKVVFRETESGAVVVEGVSSASDMQGFAARRGTASTDVPATELLRAERRKDLDER